MKREMLSHAQRGIEQGRRIGITCVSQAFERRRYGPTDGPTDVKTEVQTDGPTDERTCPLIEMR